MNHNYTMKRLALTWSLLCFVLLLQAQVPKGYYSSTKGQSGKALKTALFNKIANHTQLSYKALWNAYKTTDVRADGSIWDMYSDITSYKPGGSAQGANYKKEGDSYNREHSFPKSWFNDEYPMFTDLFHLYPTDGYVNNRRSNYPFGETKGETYTSANNFSKLGKSTINGYSGVVFEPNDEYKGDFARSYFYMATAYEDRIAEWSSPMLDGSAYPAYTKWALTMLLRWAQEDPVSQKEIDRNNAVYKLQGNRNPYIDYPGLEQYVWGTKTSTAFDPDNYDNGGGSIDPTPDPKPVEVNAPVFSPLSGVVAKGTEITISTSTEGATLYYTVNQGEMQTAYMSTTLAINANTTIKAYAMLGENKSDEVEATYTLQPDAPVGQNVYTLVTDDATLSAGQQLLFVCNDTKKNSWVAMGCANATGDIRTYATIDAPVDSKITTEVGGADQPYSFTLGGNATAWTFYDQASNTYLALNEDKNKLHSVETVDSKEGQWIISIKNNGMASISNAAYTNRLLQYNQNSPRFATYTGSQKAVSIYCKANSTTAINKVVTQTNGHYNVYNAHGQLIRRSTTISQALSNLSQGIYVVNGKKILIK